MKKKIVIVCPVIVRYDAISTVARETYDCLRNDPRFEVELITCKSDFSDINVTVAHNVSMLITLKQYREADLIIYSFGIYNSLFDALLIGNGKARQAVRFHNITPAELVEERSRPLMEVSKRQMHNLTRADRIWADSEFNARALEDIGLPSDRATVIPFALSNLQGHASARNPPPASKSCS